MKIQPLILWTDLLIYILLFTILLFVAWSRHLPHRREPWHRLAERKLGMISLVLLVAYSFIALLDSIHFRVIYSQPDTRVTATQVESVLDLLLRPMGNQNEKTYSAPFSIYSSAKTTEPINGKTVTYYPRLVFGGEHLRSTLDKSWDITKKTIWAVGVGVVISTVLIFFFIYGLAYKHHSTLWASLREIIRGKTKVAWREVLLTMSFIIIVACFIKHVSSFYHILGTDKIGNDVLYETIKSIRTGLIIGTLTTLVILPFAILLGTRAGYFGGFTDDIIQYIYTTLSSVPAVLLISAAVLSLQVFIANHVNLFPTLESRADARLLALCFILGITSWTSLCRLLRAETLKLREMDYVKAAITMGVRDTRIILRHIIPNVMHIILITIVLDFSALVLAEAVLSYVGVGVDPITPSWGNMINSARLDLAREPVVWWPLFAAFVFMFVLVLSANLFADAVRDAFDPRLRGEH